jgi:N-acetylmuramoyl-L-alanine amidase-like protein
MGRAVGRALGLLVLVAVSLPAAGARAGTEPRLAVLAMDGAPRSTPFAASHLGVRWEGSEEAAVELRFAGAAGWEPWRRVEVSHDLGDEERGIRLSGLVRAPGATQVQVRSGAGARHLEVLVIDAVTGARPAAPVAASPGSSPPPVVTRAQWGADESMRKGPTEFAPVSKLVVHHTVTENDDPDPASTVRAIYAYHTRGNGWNDIGYHFLVDSAGRIYEGRYARAYRPGETPSGEDESGRGVIGAHAKGMNAGSMGVALLGNFTSAEPSGAAVDALVRVLAWKASGHGIDAQGSSPFRGSDGTSRTFPNIAGHRDVGQTGCPGGRLYDRLPDVRRRVAEATGASRPPAPAPAPPPPPIPIPGFWTVSPDGRVEAVGDAPFYGSPPGPLNAPLVGMAVSPTGGGYWLAAADGGVFAFGDARFFGSAGAMPLAAPVVRLEPTPTGGGYWLALADGAVLAFGDARFLGSVPALPVGPIVGMAATPTGDGYWLTSSEGRVFAFGDAVLNAAAAGRADSGLTAGPPSRAPIVSMAASPSGRGYWLVASDGGVFAVNVPFRGSVPQHQTYGRAVQLRVTDSGDGYYVAGGDGAMFAFGDADRRRERAGRPGGPAIVDVAVRPLRPRGAAPGSTPGVPTP